MRITRLVFCFLFLSAATFIATSSATSAENVSTGYKADGIVDLIWAAEHFGYSGPAEMQKAGVQAIKFFNAVAGITEKECDLGLSDSLDPVGPYTYESIWSTEELSALEWVADHYCITKEQAQLYGGTLFTFFAGLDSSINGTNAVRREPPPPSITNQTQEETLTESQDEVSIEVKVEISNSGLVISNLDGSNSRQLTINPNCQQYSRLYCDYGPVVSPDQTMVLFHRDVGIDNVDIFVINVDGTNEINITNGGIYPTTLRMGGSWSPDSQWITYSSDDYGDHDVYLVNKDGSQNTILTFSTNDEVIPSWSNDGEWIFYLSRLNSSVSYGYWRLDPDGLTNEYCGESKDECETTTTTTTTTTTAPANTSETFATGTWVVGSQIQPGVWMTSSTERCRWDRLSSFDGAYESIIEWDSLSGNIIVEIKNTDTGFYSDEDCGTWSR